MLSHEVLNTIDRIIKEIWINNVSADFEFVLLTPFNTNREVNDNKLEYELGKLSADRNTVMVAHTPTLGAGDILYNGWPVSAGVWRGVQHL